MYFQYIAILKRAFRFGRMLDGERSLFWRKVICMLYILALKVEYHANENQLKKSEKIAYLG